MSASEGSSKQLCSSRSSEKFTIFRSSNGYKYIHYQDGYVSHHRLLAVAAGADPHTVFGEGNIDVHHRIGQLDVPGNLEVLSRSEHRLVHNTGANDATPREVLAQPEPGEDDP